MDKIKLEKVLLFICNRFGLSGKIREKANNKLQHIEAMEYIAKHPKPMGICNGCGNAVYNGESECSDDCRDAVEVQMWGLS